MVNVGSALSSPDADEDDGWDDGKPFIDTLVKRGPYNAVPINPADLPIDRKARLKAVEEVLIEAEQTRSKSVAWSRLRWTIETGAALRLLVSEDLYMEDEEFPTLEAYAKNRLHMARGYVYELADDAARLLKIAPLSEISDKPFNASQAKVLAPLMEPYDGPVADQKTKAEVVLADLEAAGKRRTSATLRQAAAARGFLIEETSAVPAARTAGADDNEIHDAEIVENDGTRALETLHGLLQQQQAVYDSLGGGLLSAAMQSDPDAAESLLRDFLQFLGRTDHRIRKAMKPPAPDAAGG